MKELSFINHPTYLEDTRRDHHEQISCDSLTCLDSRSYGSLGLVRNEERWWKVPD